MWPYFIIMHFRLTLLGHVRAHQRTDQSCNPPQPANFSMVKVKSYMKLGILAPKASFNVRVTSKDKMLIYVILLLLKAHRSKASLLPCRLKMTIISKSSCYIGTICGYCFLYYLNIEILLQGIVTARNYSQAHAVI